MIADLVDAHEVFPVVIDDRAGGAGLHVQVDLIGEPCAESSDGGGQQTGLVEIAVE